MPRKAPASKQHDMSAKTKIQPKRAAAPDNSAALSSSDLLATLIVSMEHGWLCIRNEGQWLLWTAKLDELNDQSIALSEIADELRKNHAEWLRDQAERLEAEALAMTCPTCNGTKEVDAYFVLMADGTSKTHMKLPCYDCDGTGELDDRHPQWKEIGEQMRQDRLRRNRTLREESIARGMKASELSRMERGTAEPVMANRKLGDGR